MLATITEGYKAWQNPPFLGRYKIRRNLSPLRLSNLCQMTPIRQLGMSRRPNNTNPETEATSRTESKAKAEALKEARSEAKSEARLRSTLVGRPLMRRGLD